HRRLRLAADASAILLEGLKALAWYFLSPDMFRSEATDTRMGSGSAQIEDRTPWDDVSIVIRLRFCPSGI
ncbi:MAG: hypothetical protein WAV38_12885, partial [Xanthobacteraceae bacterium]